LLRTKERGIICRPDKNKGLDCYADADFAGGWDRGELDTSFDMLDAPLFGAASCRMK